MITTTPQKRSAYDESICELVWNRANYATINIINKLYFE